MSTPMRDVIRLVGSHEPGVDRQAAYAELVARFGKPAAPLMWGSALLYVTIRDDAEAENVTVTGMVSTCALVLCGIGAVLAGQPVRAGLIGAAIAFGLVAVGQAIGKSADDEAAVMGDTDDGEEFVMVRRPRRWWL
ncbi:hypothetical protein F4553_003055 [Allocatelliglobosispora scoriae]|uniref:Uncharacterized protein n=1 Tax=Allocatelliglobosispora scoriae TaxID=643052 RepID=A0A841BQQ9_9ACTN|nr:hypothetical protein [Allocatelliglobosispora scoriae]MBB5869676.1 hypothetical protein [Allocatelliglobosispora scoriae]